MGGDGQRPRLAALALAAFAFATVLAPRASEAAARALLIGVNDYIEVPDLRGAINDVEMMREIIVTRFGFAPADIEVVTDANATRAGILAAFDRLAARTQPGDLVYIHYSGHGSQVTDLNGDEDDKMDETLVPHDGRTPGVPDITDDELGDKLDALRAETVVIVLDSCHAGTATRAVGGQGGPRAGGVRSRYVPPDSRDELYASLRRQGAGVGTRAVVPLVAAGHVLFTGAANNEEALDGPVDRKPHGLFSYALGASLARAAPTASPRDVFTGVESEFERIRAQLSLNKMPDPQLEAERADLDNPLFATAPAGAAESGAPARLAWIEANAAGRGRARLARGAALGAGLGSIWAVYPPGELRFAPGAAIAMANVTALEGTDAIASLAPATIELPKGARAIALAPPPAADDIPVALVDEDAKRASALRKALEKRLAAVRFVGEGEFARFVVRCNRSTCVVTGADGTFELATLDASKLESLVDPLASLFARSLTVSELMSLANSASDMQVELAVVAKEEPVLAPGDERGMKLVASSDTPRFRVRKQGEPRTRENSLQLRIKPSAACTLTVVDIDAQGGVVVLFPNAISEKRGYFPGGKLDAGQELLLPDSLAAGNRAGFHIDYSPPAGTDTVRAFCTRDPRAAEALRESIASLDPNVPGTRSAKRERVGSLRQQLAALAARGLRIVEDVPQPEVAQPSESEPPPEPEEDAPIVAGAWSADWAAAAVTVEVRE